MSLNEYDIIKRVNKEKTWIDVKRKLLLTRELKHKYNYFNFSTKFNIELKENEYFIITGTKPPLDNIIYYDDYGRAKFNISSIFNSIGANKSDNNFNVNFQLIESNVQYDIYKIDI